MGREREDFCVLAVCIYVCTITAYT